MTRLEELRAKRKELLERSNETFSEMEKIIDNTNNIIENMHNEDNEILQKILNK